MPKPVHKWSAEMCIQLIRQYKKWPVLWDSAHPSYFCHSRKHPIWNKIGEAMNKPPDECKRKMSNMLSCFRYEKSKLQRLGGNTGKKGRTEWFAYKHLKFLLNRGKRRDMQNQSIQISDDSNEVESVTETANNTNENIDTVESVTKTANDSHDTKDDIEVLETFEFTKFNKDEDEIIIELDEADTNTENKITITSLVEFSSKNQPGPSQTQPIDLKSILQMQKAKDDELNVFIKFVESKMRTYSLEKLHEVERQICEILFKADETNRKSFFGSQ